jgi:hypothetical protein
MSNITWTLLAQELRFGAAAYGGCPGGARDGGGPASNSARRVGPATRPGNSARQLGPATRPLSLAVESRGRFILW